MNKYKIDNTSFGLFKIAFNLLDNKILCMSCIILNESLSLLLSYVIITENLWMCMFYPILIKILNYMNKKYFNNQEYKIKNNWKKQMFNYFYTFSYQSRKNTIMNDFSSQIEKTGDILTNMSSYIPKMILQFIINLFSCITSFIYQIYVNCNSKLCFNIIIDEKYYIIIIIPFLIYYYYYKRFLIKQNDIANLRILKKNIEKKYMPITQWNLQLFQNRKKNIDEIIKIDNEINDIDKNYYTEWHNISTESVLFFEIIINVIIYTISKDFKSMLINKLMFDKLSSSIDNITFLTTYLNNCIKDFDKLVDYLNEITIEPIENQYKIIYPLKIMTNINLKNFILYADNLSINYNDKILLRGETGIGKTQLVNSIQGLINGTNFNYLSPKQFENCFEYMNQQTRETIPNFGITIRQILENEMDDKLINYLLNIVELNNKFTNYDEPINNLSGGEKMRLSILYTIWNLEKQNKQILILDEPEQGLDEDTRVNVIKNILKLEKPILIIYHGSKIDLLQFSFNKVWIFNKNNNITNVIERNFIDYRIDLINEIKSMF